MRLRDSLLRHALLAAVLLGGLAELLVLQGWRLRERLQRQPR